jgi:hypothetical protein
MAESKRPTRRPKPDNGDSAAVPPDDGDYTGGQEEYSEPRGVHNDFLTRYYGGGEAATPELFAKASAVWRQLPGATTRLPAGFARLADDTPLEDEPQATEVAE